jgi:NTE family protein
VAVFFAALGIEWISLMRKTLLESGQAQELHGARDGPKAEPEALSNRNQPDESLDSATHRKEEEGHTKNKDINLALQGGGAHGAFAWGVLDYLLEDGRLDVEGISATSAGAVNAVVCASGMLKDGRTGARLALSRFWRAVADLGATYKISSSNWSSAFSNIAQIQRAQLRSFFEAPTEISSLYFTNLMDLNPFFQFFGGRSAMTDEPFSRNFMRMMLHSMSSILSPYYFNPYKLNPLKDLLEEHVDFAALRSAQTGLKLHLCATNVETGKIRIFKNAELTADAVLASTCMPFLFQAVEIEGSYYWDGGYIGNPAIFPLIYETRSCDVMVVHIDPIIRKGCPRSVLDIMNRHNEISFNSSLMREMRAIAFINRLMENGSLNDPEMKRMRVHAIRAESAMSELSALTKAETDWDFLHMLFQAGREAASAWLDGNYEKVGHESTINLETDYL